MKNKILTALAISAMATSSLSALETDKVKLANNMILTYKEDAKRVNSITDMFKEGQFFGRMRFNSFYWDWAEEEGTNNKDNSIAAVGGSLTYRTALYNGFGATVGLYNASPLASTNYTKLKAGADVYFKGAGEENAAINTLAIAFLEYNNYKTSAKLGRQKFESTLLRSNDTKMVPNTFQGYSIDTKIVSKTRLRAAYFDKQKLRNHEGFGSIIAVDGTNGNDDSARHKGLTLAKISAAEVNANPGMVVLTAQNRSIKGLKLNADYMFIDGFVSSIIPEVNYKIDIGNGWSVTPGARYISQIDEGAGAIGGAALSGKVSTATPGGYTNPNSVDASAWMTRIKVKKGAGNIMLGYSSIDNKADIIAPWRGFPTGGYTRSMAQYNWEAGTNSWMLKAGYNFGKAGLVSGLRMNIDYAVMDYDRAKELAGSISKTDRSIIHLDVWKTFKSLPDLELKFRAASVNADKNIGEATDDQSYNEYRLEANYLF
ncbi:MAG: outer membrane porin, OprD family [Helicobacteraceae bacterium]|nr:outer membrane porin, OprD family [Helicobacteraceae bacterium]